MNTSEQVRATAIFYVMAASLFSSAVSTMASEQGPTTAAESFVQGYASFEDPWLHQSVTVIGCIISIERYDPRTGEEGYYQEADLGDLSPSSIRYSNQEENSHRYERYRGVGSARIGDVTARATNGKKAITRGENQVSTLQIDLYYEEEDIPRRVSNALRDLVEECGGSDDSY